MVLPQRFRDLVSDGVAAFEQAAFQGMLQPSSKAAELRNMGEGKSSTLEKTYGGIGRIRHSGIAELRWTGATWIVRKLRTGQATLDFTHQPQQWMSSVGQPGR
jgi:hypothetical protein